MSDDTRRWEMTLEEAGDALREAAQTLASASPGWLVCQAAQFPVPPRAPTPLEVELWILGQGYRLQRSP